MRPWVAQMRNLLFTVLLLGTTTVGAEQKQLHLEIGDPARKGREVPVTLDAIVDTGSGELLTPSELPAHLAGVRLLFVGESHTDIDFHRVQLRILEELRAAGRRVLIGLEMFPYTEQAHLDAWVAGRYTEEGFVHFSKWYDSWFYNWRYYRDIFLFAREHGLAMFAVNAPREVVRAVREKGFEDLTEEEAAHVPTEIDVTSEEHRLLFRSYFDEDDALHSQMSDEQWDGMIRAQATWDATMGYNSVNALASDSDPNAILVVLIGSGHVAYGLGIERQAKQWYEAAMASIIPVPIADEEGEPIETVRASYADFVWGLPPATDPLYPSLGLSTREIEGDEHRRVIFVSEGSPAEEAGFALEDILLSMDGTDLDSKEVLGRLMADKRWGDTASFVVRRGEETLELGVLLRRKRAEDRSAPPDE